MHRSGTVASVIAGAALLAAAAATAGIAIEDKPVALVTGNIVMHAGQPFVPLSELAKALGGTGRYDPARLRYEIQPGPNGVLISNPGLLSAQRPGGGPDRPGRGRTADRNAFSLAIGGGEVSVDDVDDILVRPGDPAVSLGFLAHLLGGKARFDPGRGSWVLPPGGSGTPLRFR